MPMSHSGIHRLIATYRAANYAVRLPGGARAVLRIDAPVPRGLGELLHSVGVDREARVCGFISAWNPFSQPAPRDENRGRQRALLRRLRAAADRVLVGAGYGEDWREPSFAALGLDLGQLDGCAREFRQNAVLTFRAHGLVRLRLYRDDWRAALTDSESDFAPSA